MSRPSRQKGGSMEAREGREFAEAMSKGQPTRGTPRGMIVVTSHDGKSCKCGLGDGVVVTTNGDAHMDSPAVVNALIGLLEDARDAMWPPQARKRRKWLFWRRGR